MLGDAPVVSLAGPALAAEILAGSPTGLLCASRDQQARRCAAEVLASPTTAVFTTSDVAGAETAAAFKNVVAVAVGLAEGLSDRLGESGLVATFANARAAVFARGMMDMLALVEAQGGRAATVLGLAGAGDLYVTCGHGRNGRFGRLLGSGATVEGAIRSIGSTVEGVANTAPALLLAARTRLDLPSARVVELALKRGSDRRAGQRPAQGPVPDRRVRLTAARQQPRRTGVTTMDYDVIVIGSGFGGSVTALRLTEKGYRVGVLEAGRRFEDADYPRTSWDARKFLWAPKLGCRGIQRIHLLRDVIVLAGAGVGGGSLVYANTLYRPKSDAFYHDRQWAHLTDWRAELAPYYDQAERMLGVTAEPDDDGGGRGHEECRARRWASGTRSAWPRSGSSSAGPAARSRASRSPTRSSAAQARPAGAASRSASA